MGEPLERGRRDEHRRRHGAPEHGRAELAPADVDERARPQPDAPPRRHVVRHRPLVVGAAGVVVVHHPRQPLGGDGVEIVDGQMGHSGSVLFV
jgi:hypothetical protein